MPFRRLKPAAQQHEYASLLNAGFSAANLDR
jgi:hypothetical protein